mmetsp:Transcript_178621/g.566826  ORF Transcript_178621/g.566826 Transcript_178621/m.566826 type:complete len:314 (-) Transcript_178621:190-1131(-)
MHAPSCQAAVQGMEVWDYEEVCFSWIVNQKGAEQQLLQDDHLGAKLPHCRIPSSPSPLRAWSSPIVAAASRFQRSCLVNGPHFMQEVGMKRRRQVVDEDAPLREVLGSRGPGGAAATASEKGSGQVLTEDLGEELAADPRGHPGRLRGLQSHRHIQRPRHQRRVRFPRGHRAPPPGEGRVMQLAADAPNPAPEAIPPGIAVESVRFAALAIQQKQLYLWHRGQQEPREGCRGHFLDLFDVLGVAAAATDRRSTRTGIVHAKFDGLGTLLADDCQIVNLHAVCEAVLPDVPCQVPVHHGLGLDGLQTGFWKTES